MFLLVIQDAVWGVAYELVQESLQETKERLDEREKRYDTKMDVAFFSRDGERRPFAVTCYVAPVSGPLFVGAAPMEAMAAQICSARGPSGRNIDYLTQLVDFMNNEAGVHCDHLFEIERAVRQRSSAPV